MDMSKYMNASSDEGSDDGVKEKKTYITYVRSNDLSKATENQKMLDDGYKLTMQLRSHGIPVTKMVYEQCLVPAVAELNNELQRMAQKNQKDNKA